MHAVACPDAHYMLPCSALPAVEAALHDPAGLAAAAAAAGTEDLHDFVFIASMVGLLGWGLGPVFALLLVCPCSTSADVISTCALLTSAHLCSCPKLSCRASAAGRRAASTACLAGPTLRLATASFPWTFSSRAAAGAAASTQ